MTRYGRLTVLHREGRTAWVLCDCGEEKTVCYYELTRTSRPLRSCGCLHSQAVSLATRRRHLERRRRRAQIAERARRELDAIGDADDGLSRIRRLAWEHVERINVPARRSAA